MKLPVLIVISTILSLIIVFVSDFLHNFAYVEYVLLLLVLGINCFAVFKTRKTNPVQPTKIIEPTSQVTASSQSSSDETMHEAIIENIGQGLVVTDKNAKIISFNKAAQVLLGWTKQEALGKSLHDIVNVNYSDNKNFGNQAKLYFVRKDSSTFPAAISSTSFVQGGKILGTITLFRDITTEQNVDAIRNEFISLASHQLRTPLAAIKWYCDMLIKGTAGVLSQKQMEFMKTIYDSTEKMVQLVNALLNISRIESGRLAIDPKPTELKPYIEDILKDVIIRYREKQQKFELHIPHDFPEVTFDQGLVRQIFINLLTNAAKYTPEHGTIQITVSQKDSNIVIGVKDNGYGIPKSEKQRVFDKFYRGANIVQKVNDGTGLGLYLVKAIVELCKGTISYDSEEGKGTTFWVSLPLSGVAAKKGSVSLSE